MKGSCLPAYTCAGIDGLGLALPHPQRLSSCHFLLAPVAAQVLLHCKQILKCTLDDNVLQHDQDTTLAEDREA